MCDLGAETGGDSWGAAEGRRGREPAERQVCMFRGGEEAEEGSDQGNT